MGKDTQTEITKRLSHDVVYMTTGGFEYLIDQQGGSFLGFSARAAYGDALLVVRAEFNGMDMVSFVSSGTVAGCLARSHKELREGRVKWRVDKFSKDGGIP